MATLKESKIIASVVNLINKLPEDNLMEEVKEIELITKYLDPALQPLFDDLDDDIIFRWTSTSNPEAKNSTISISQRRPDSLINSLNDLHVGKSLGFGEVKAKYQSSNNFAIAKDLIRLGVFSKNGIDVGKLNGVITFQAAGLQVTFYITMLVANGLYMMLEIGYLKLPGSLHDLLSCVVHLSDVLDIVNIFYNECLSPPSFLESRKRSSISTPETNHIVESSRDRKRACITSYYT
ncbi:unnamed protein product [Cunninghamella blakesleeana]